MSNPSTPASGGMTEPEEVEQLRARVTQLEAQLATAARTTTAEPRPARERWRSVTAAVLIVMACILAPLSVVAVWADNQVSDTDRYVENVAPLAENPGIQKAITDQVTAEILTRIDLDKITREALAALSEQDLPAGASASLQALQVPLVNAIEGFIRDQVAKIVASDSFRQVWDEANRGAHDQLVALLSGESGGALTAENDAVTINLKPIVEQVKQRLVDQGLGLAASIPAVDESFVLVQSEGVTKAQGLYRLLNTLGTWLPIIALVLLGLGVYVARGHRRALMLGALGIVGAMLMLGLLLAIGRGLYLDNRPTDVLPRDVASEVFDTLVRFLRAGLRAVAVLFLIVAAGAFLTGPTVTAVRTREGLTRGLGFLRGSAESRGLSTGRVGTWTFAHKQVLRIGIAIVAGFVLVFWNSPTVSVVVWTAVVVVVCLGLVELLGRPPVDEAAAGAESQPEDEHATVQTTPREPR